VFKSPHDLVKLTVITLGNLKISIYHSVTKAENTFSN
jgi:hypothetical protein